MLEDATAEVLVGRLWPDWCNNRTRSEEWQAWALGKQELPVVPDSATYEYQSLQQKAITPWLGLVVGAFVQALIVDGYRPTRADEDNLLWSVWQANRMDARQSAVYDGALTTGTSYVAVLPTGAPRARLNPVVEDMAVPEWRLYSSADMTAFYESPHDDWPVYAIAAEPSPMWRQSVGEDPVYRATLFDESHIYTLNVKNGQAVLTEDPREHGMATCPVVAYVPRRTITGRAIGEVEPYTAIASRIDQDVLDRLIVQRFASWRVRWATGLVTPATEEDEAQQELALKVSDILVSDSPDTQFGSLPATELSGHLQAPMTDVRMLSAVAQVPPTILTADLSNISAEALAAVDAAFNRKVEHLKEEFGESHEKTFDLSAQAMRIDRDHSAQVRWRDMESRSMGQEADALGKLASQLQIPAEVLWDKVSILTDQDRERAKQILEGSGGMEALFANLAQQQIPTVEPAA